MAEGEGGWGEDLCLRSKCVMGEGVRDGDEVKGRIGLKKGEGRLDGGGNEEVRIRQWKR